DARLDLRVHLVAIFQLDQVRRILLLGVIEGSPALWHEVFPLANPAHHLARAAALGALRLGSSAADSAFTDIDRHAGAHFDHLSFMILVPKLRGAISLMKSLPNIGIRMAVHVHVFPGAP